MKLKPPKGKKHLCMPALLRVTKNCFAKIVDPVKGVISIANCLMSGVALFGLKYPSLLQFDISSRNDKIVKHNLNTLYGISQAPSDTYMRERLDEVEPELLQKSINKIIALLQRGKVLEQYRYYQDYCLVSIDGTGYFSSKEIHCENCCEKKHIEKDGTETITYYHQMLAAVMVHPAYKTVFPLQLEAITKQDGATKNDCEHSAAKRLLRKLRTNHPHLKILIVLDGLYADSSIIRLLNELNMPFIIGAKEKDLKYLFEEYAVAKVQEVIRTKNKTEHTYKFASDLPLNYANSDLKVNMLELFEKTDKKSLHFCWITNLELTKDNVDVTSIGGRARWKIENETFNTLKNQGYQFERNFGHGNKYLSVVMVYLMFQAFLIDQVQEFCCKYFKAALKAVKRKIVLWQRMRGLFFDFRINSWETLYTAMSGGFRGMELTELLNNSS